MSTERMALRRNDFAAFPNQIYQFHLQTPKATNEIK